MKTTIRPLSVAGLLLLLTTAISCLEEEPSTLPTVTTAEIKGITKISALAGGNVTADGNEEITSRGVVWSTAPNPDITVTTKSDEGTGIGSFVSELEGLTPGTSYYVRAYAANVVGIAYGEVAVFETKPLNPPKVETNEAADVTFQSATLSGKITDGGDAEVTDRGLVYGTSQMPTINNTKISLGSGVGEFSAELTDLEPATKYFVRAYGVNTDGTSYGNQVSFETAPLVPPVVSTGTISNVKAFSVKAAANATSAGTSSITSRGFVYSTSPNPDLESTKTTVGQGVGEFTADITGLLAGTKYYLRAFATSAHGTGYGDQVSFTTEELVILPASFSGNWYNVSGTWIWAISETSAGKYIRTNNVLYYYQPDDVAQPESGVYSIRGTSSTGTALTAYLKQGTDTNKIYISTSSASAGFIEYGHIVGRTVKRVTHSGGSFQLSSGTAWVEKNSAGATTFNFTETSRDDWSVYLRDNDGRGNLQIDVHLKTTFWTPTGGARAELYKLTGMFND